jgi:hypothetical protein
MLERKNKKLGYRSRKRELQGKSQTPKRQKQKSEWIDIDESRQELQNAKCRVIQERE